VREKVKAVTAFRQKPRWHDGAPFSAFEYMADHLIGCGRLRWKVAPPIRSSVPNTSVSHCAFRNKPTSRRLFRAPSQTKCGADCGTRFIAANEANYLHRQMSFPPPMFSYQTGARVLGTAIAGTFKRKELFDVAANQGLRYHGAADSASCT